MEERWLERGKQKGRKKERRRGWEGLEGEENGMELTEWKGKRKEGKAKDRKRKEWI